ncbi:hypothetical protein [Serpentinicella alkaliphila]|uniref:Uncharacterized protein n=1 Tax=Serpentinicella alkaliphila TaxID=1734049 RepID=A0A4R2TZW2_9FIRM|nr:hypothetical protein [Serpentinicella alkaliphila]QUH25254.1 hypothetical protein HZR23_05400 [Serpentinicella alkaliphila]TCQ07065.1 hypothetical protein EDD79_100261 [Serpentinicella alkaliphila]
MNIITTVVTGLVILVDFLRIEKSSKKIIIVYFFIVALAILTSLESKYQFFEISPFEIMIDKMQPITDWLFGLLA